MTCRDIADLCTAYVDGELDDLRASAVRGHARVCSECRQLLANEERVRDAAAELEPVDPPAALWEGIEARLAAAEIDDSERPRWWFWWHGLRQRALPIAVGVAAVIALGVWVWRPGSTAAPRVAPSEVATVEVPDPEPAAPVVDFEGARRAEIARADARYRAVLADLREIALDEAGDVEPAALARLEVLGTERDRALAAAPNSSEPSDRDPVRAAYDREIDALRSLAFAGVTR